MAFRTALRVPVRCLLVAAIALTGCSQAKSTKTKTSTPSSSVTSSSVPPSTSAKPTPSPSVTGKPGLGGRCADLLPVTAVDTALGRPIIGKTSDILGIAEPNIGRLTYLNCRYGVPAPVKGKPAAAPQVEIGISLYKSLDQAARRVAGTVQDYRGHGSNEQVIAIGQYSGSILIGYGAPTLVIAAGPRTVAITIDAKLVATAPSSALTALAKVALDATAGYTGAPGEGAISSSAGGSPSASSS